MKKLLLFILLALPMFARAKMFYKDGMVWVVERGSCQPGIPHITETFELDGIATIDGIEALQLFQTSGSESRSLTMFLRVDDQKVYFRLNTPEATEWYLLYDFSLQPGEGCDIFNPQQMMAGKDAKTHIECLSLSEASESIPWPTMTIKETFPTDPIFDEVNTLFVGLGSHAGPAGDLFNGMDGSHSTLLSATYKGQTVFRSQASAGIDGITFDKDTQIYTIAGQACTDTAKPGIYILKSAASARKIIVQ